MSTAAQPKGGAENDFVLAQVGGRFLRFGEAGDVPSGSEVVTRVVLDSLTKEKLGEMYGAIAGVNSKNFKTKELAIESLCYQVAKLPVFDPKNVATPQPTSQKPTKVAKRANEVLEVLFPADVPTVLRALAPQARELVSILTELAKEKNSPSFSAKDLEEKLKVPEVAARLKTKQDPLRIFAYYKGNLIGAGLLRTS